jgi:hypothetical protein
VISIAWRTGKNFSNLAHISPFSLFGEEMKENSLRITWAARQSKANTWGYIILLNQMRTPMTITSIITAPMMSSTIRLVRLMRGCT